MFNRMYINASKLEPKFENLKQKYFNFWMLEQKVIDFSLSDIKKLRHFYVLSKCIS